MTDKKRIEELELALKEVLRVANHEARWGNFPIDVVSDAIVVLKKNNGVDQ